MGKNSIKTNAINPLKSRLPSSHNIHSTFVCGIEFIPVSVTSSHLDLSLALFYLHGRGNVHSPLEVSYSAPLGRFSRLLETALLRQGRVYISIFSFCRRVHRLTFTFAVLLKVTHEYPGTSSGTSSPLPLPMLQTALRPLSGDVPSPGLWRLCVSPMH